MVIRCVYVLRYEMKSTWSGSGGREVYFCLFFFSSRRRHTRSDRDWSSDVCSSDLNVRISSWNEFFGLMWAGSSSDIMRFVAGDGWGGGPYSPRHCRVKRWLAAPPRATDRKSVV